MSLSNPSLAAFLLDDGPRCVVVSYDRVRGANGKDQPTELKSFKTFDTSIKVGDKVVVPTDTRWGFTVGRVEVVDTRVNYSSSETMRWIASVVDEKAYEHILAQEEVLIGKVAQAQESRAKRELADELRTLDPELTGLRLSAPVPERNGGAEAPARGGAQASTPAGYVVAKD